MNGSPARPVHICGQFLKSIIPIAPAVACPLSRWTQPNVALQEDNALHPSRMESQESFLHVLGASTRGDRHCGLLFPTSAVQEYPSNLIYMHYLLFQKFVNCNKTKFGTSKKEMQ